ncbi:hypothetical protein, unlikely [Trypanosoma congolense IL3000]|uniref:Uncharacterized protein n=1 Tax=Trypanosoma congolense (strain IL3000) TaxID=1068625 RepID=F9WHS4_TRYCI|nr:hypothetical protein, unlikely [Trypanosoma congolense IL3000]
MHVWGYPLRASFGFPNGTSFSDIGIYSRVVLQAKVKFSCACPWMEGCEGISHDQWGTAGAFECGARWFVLVLCALFVCVSLTAACLYGVPSRIWKRNILFLLSPLRIYRAGQTPTPVLDLI